VLTLTRGMRIRTSYSERQKWQPVVLQREWGHVALQYAEVRAHVRPGQYIVIVRYDRVINVSKHVN
jgi:hypothetical protein